MSANLFSLAGKTAIVTGGNVGLGQAIALALAEAGADIVSTSRRPAEETGAKVKALGRRFVSIEADLSSTAPIAGIVERTVSEFGKVDILVNNAGIIRRNDSVDFTEEDWDAVIDTNLKSAFFLAQAVGRHMISQGHGKIINIASMLSFQGGIRVPSYTASKSGLAGITKLLACEWAGKGVNVNAIAPGYMSTDNTEALRADPKRNAQILDRIPAGRWGESSDMGGAAVFLASAASDYVHGAIIPVDGGWLAR
ncbi:2-dehydro-3-deoxy-D-gluconate 5-dehydrogenase KduD [Vitreimonas flagellata]|uniref:2-dehydro-3-deoxy-D-gluconate 5-dehydrogenase KduD n=1 Tax=Vitreimonas flagellata TaxID=2560861 RepID=UPI0010749F4A|nr:2-dehydro-3-deoxy-D-gluconate 5-dehydrogenase KduD [Vitreimonas flagellata]